MKGGRMRTLEVDRERGKKFFGKWTMNEQNHDDDVGNYSYKF